MHSVLQFFVPNNEQFFDLLEEQALNGLACAKTFREMAEHFPNLSEKEIAAKIRELKELERKGDEAEQRLTKKLQSSFVTPIDREALYQLSILLEEQVDCFFHTARKIQDFEVTRLPSHYPEQARLALASIELVKEAVFGLRKMKKVDGLHQKVHDLEEEADRFYSKAIRSLFSRQTDAKEIIRQKELYEGMEDSVDKAKHIMEVVRGIVISHA